MTRVINGSRRVLLGILFVAVMAGTGGMLGALTGVVLVLLSKVVLGMSMGFAELMPGSVLFGTLAALALGVVLTARHTISFSWQPKLVAPTPTENNQTL